MKLFIAIQLLMILAVTTCGANGYASTQPMPTPMIFGDGVISTGDFESHPTFTPDGLTLYFLKSTPTSVSGPSSSLGLLMGDGRHRKSLPSQVDTATPILSSPLMVKSFTSSRDDQRPVRRLKTSISGSWIKRKTDGANRATSDRP